MGNFTFPKIPLTGDEKTPSELCEPDERAICDVEQLQAPFLHVEKSLSETVPENLRERIAVARHLATYVVFRLQLPSLSAWAFRTKLLPEDIPIPLQEIVNSFNNRLALEIFPD
jgi:hypothetical protein